jgi:hypothetical protein
MPKKSKRKRRELKAAKASAKLLKPQQQASNYPQQAQPYPDGSTHYANIAPETNVSTITNNGAILAIIGTVGLGVAAFIQFYNHSAAIWALFLALITYVHLLMVELKKYGKSASVANSTGGILALVVLLLCCVMQGVESGKLIIGALPKPLPTLRLQLGLVTSHAPRSFLILTNLSLPQQFPTKPFQISPTSQTIAITTFENETNVDLQFWVGNDPTSSSDMEDVKVSVILPKTCHFKIGSSWMVYEKGASITAKDFEFQQLFVKFNQDLIPSDNNPLPAITFSAIQPAPFQLFLPIFLEFRGKNFPPAMVAFALTFPEMQAGDSAIVPPQFVSPILTNGDWITFKMSTNIE